MSIAMRKDVPQEDCWELSDLFASDADWRQAGKDIDALVLTFIENYEGKIKGSSSQAEILKAIFSYDEIYQQLSPYASYASLDHAADHTDPQKAQKAKEANSFLAETRARLSFFESELSLLSSDLLADLAQDKNFNAFLKMLIKKKDHLFGAETERVLQALSGSVLDLPYQSYQAAKLADLSFPDFTVKHKTYPLSFSLFENKYQLEPDKKIRHQAFNSFSEGLGKYRHSIANAYNAQVQKEISLSRLRGYSSVIDYLLEDQEVDSDLFHRQIDLITTHLAEPMRRYAEKIKKIHSLTEMSWADLKLTPTAKAYPEITRDQAKELIKNAVAGLGEEYQAIIERAFSERWIDFAENIGKSTGAFCAQPYGRHPFILVNWQKTIDDVYTLAHELGHATQTIIAQKGNQYLQMSPSLYFIEAPSTIHELLLTQYLMTKAEYKNIAAVLMVANTYYHNFVTHLLEAAFQREVYSTAEKGKNLVADDFDQIKYNVLQAFWGKDIIINPGAERTWMRQPHYYMGLYPYTYSAGLTIATAVSLRFEAGDEKAASDWLATLAAGGAKDPVGLAKIAGVDITSDRALLDTIAYIDSLIGQI